MQEWRLEPAGRDGGVESLSTPFEDWCAERNVHPETLGAWECFEAGRKAARHDELAGA